MTADLVECVHDWIETAEAEGSGFYELCLKCGDDREAQS